jgi:hypothetical protein
MRNFQLEIGYSATNNQTLKALVDVWFRDVKLLSVGCDFTNNPKDSNILSFKSTKLPSLDKLIQLL